MDAVKLVEGDFGVNDIWWEIDIWTANFCNWWGKHSGVDVSMMPSVKEIIVEKRRLKKMLS